MKKEMKKLVEIIKTRNTIKTLIAIVVGLMLIILIKSCVRDTNRAGKPILKKVDNKWYSEKVVQIEVDGVSKNDIDHYVYCIRQDKWVNKCEWKETYTKNVVVSQNGINYVWFRVVDKNGVMGAISDPVVVKIDNESPDAQKIETIWEDDHTLKIIVKEEDDDDSKTKYYYYSIDGENFEKSEENEHIFKDIEDKENVEVTVILEDELGNRKEITVKVEDKEENKDKKEEKKENTNEKEKQNNEEDNNNQNNSANTNINNIENNENNQNTPSQSETIILPKISLSGVPSEFYEGEKYNLPTSYSPANASKKCVINGKEYTDTSSLLAGEYQINCTSEINGLVARTKKTIKVVPLSKEEKLMDGWIRMNLYYPDNTTEWKWRLATEETRTGEGNDAWHDYTGPILVKLEDVENIYISYKTKDGEEVIIAPKNKLVVDIRPKDFAVKQGKKTSVEIKYNSDATKKQYKLDDGQWQDYTGKFEVGPDTYIQARVVKEENGKKKTSYDMVYISILEEEVPTTSTVNKKKNEITINEEGTSKTYVAAKGVNYKEAEYLNGPEILVEPETMSEEVTVSIVPEKQARSIYYKIGNGKYKEYKSPFKIEENTVIYAYYIDEENGETSLVSQRYITNVLIKQKPTVTIGLSSIENYQESVDVTINALNYTEGTLKYSLDGVIYSPYTGSFTVRENCTIYAKAENENGETEVYRYVSNIGVLKEISNLDIDISLIPDESKVTGLINKAEVEITYDEKAVNKYYKLGFGEWVEYTGKFEITSNTTIYAYATGENARGLASKNVKYLTTGIADPEIEISPASPAEEVEVTINYPSSAKVKKYRINDGPLKVYTGSFYVEENGVIYAYCENELKQSSESERRITNIQELPRYFVLKEGDYFVVRLNYPITSDENTREYKWTNNGEWKQYDKKGILLVDKSHQNESFPNGITIEVDGERVTYTDNYYFVSEEDIENLGENIYMRWDYVKPSAPVITLSSTEAESEVDVTITYDNYSKDKKYKIVYPNGEETDWMDYKNKITIKENNTIIYAKGIASFDLEGQVASKKITNIDEEAPEVYLRGNLTKKTRQITAQIVGEDDLGIEVVGWAKGSRSKEYFEEGNGYILPNNSIFKITENGIYTIFAKDKLGHITIKEINVTNIDLDAPNIIINVLTTEYGSQATVEIDYGDSDLKQYKFSQNDTYKNYESILIIDAANVFQFKNEDGSLTIYAKGKDEAGNETEVSENIYVLDLDAPSAPVITSSSGYSTISVDGISADNTTSIVFDTRDDIKNYYSIDNENWIEYTGPIHENAGVIYAKSVKPSSGLTIKSQVTVSTPNDAVTASAYTGPNNTQSLFSPNNFINVDSSMVGYVITGSTNADSIAAVYETGATKQIRFPYRIEENVVRINFWCRYNDGKLSDLRIVKTPDLYIDEYGATVLKSTGFEDAKDKVRIEYFPTEAQMLYKIGENGKWKTYTGILDVTTGQTVYAKSISADGKETEVVSIYVKPQQTLTPDAYSGPENSQNLNVTSDNYLYIDSSMWGYVINGSYTGSGSMGACYEDGHCTSSPITFPYRIDQGVVKINFWQRYGTTLSNLRVIKTPDLYIDEYGTTLLKTTGFIDAKDKIRISYFPTESQRLYKIGENGDWKNYTGPIDVVTGQTVYAKSIDSDGVETEVANIYVTPYETLTPDAYSGPDKSQTLNDTANDHNHYVNIDSSMWGYVINASLSANMIVKVVFESGSVKQVNLPYRIEENVVKVNFWQHYTGSISSVRIIKTPDLYIDEYGVATATSSGFIDAKDKIRISYFPTESQRLYKIGENGDWKNYTGPIDVVVDQTVYAKSIDSDGVETEVASIYVKPNETLTPSAYSGSDNSQKLNVTPNNYLHIDSSLWGSTLSGFISGSGSMVACYEDGHCTSSAITLPYVIDQNVVKINFWQKYGTTVSNLRVE